MNPSRALLLALALLLSGCNYDLVDKSEKVVISKKEYEDLKAKAELAKQVGRYQQYRAGYRTFRLDTSTGESCLLLTIKADWRKADTQASACEVVGPGIAEVDVLQTQPRRFFYLLEQQDQQAASKFLETMADIYVERYDAKRPKAKGQ